MAAGECTAILMLLHFILAVGTQFATPITHPPSVLPRINLQELRRTNDVIYIAKMAKASSSQLVGAMSEMFAKHRIPACGWHDVAVKTPERMWADDNKRSRFKCYGFSLAGGYWLADQIVSTSGRQLHLITSLRSPLSRIISSLKYGKYKGIVKKKRAKFDENIEVEKAAQKLRHQGGRLDNFMTNLLSCRGGQCVDHLGVGGRGVPGENETTIEQLMIAKTELDRSFAIIISEHYQASLCILMYQVGEWDQPKCGKALKCGDRQHTGRKLTGTKRKIPSQGRIRDKATNSVPPWVKLELTGPNMEWLKIHNSYDAELYSHGLEIFRRRLDLVRAELNMPPCSQ